MTLMKIAANHLLGCVSTVASTFAAAVRNETEQFLSAMKSNMSCVVGDIFDPYLKDFANVNNDVN